MFFSISNSLKKRFVLIFQEIFLKHPIFNKVEVFTKFPETERPKNALMIRSVSGNSMKLGLDNFVRTDIQYSSLANLKKVQGNSIEWVRDDARGIENLSAPGFYIVKMNSTIVDKQEKFTFNVTPFLLVDDEKLDIQFIEGKKGAYLKNIPINSSTDIITGDKIIDLKRDIDYTIEYATGKILFNTSIDEFESVYIDYQVLSETSKEYEIEYYMANTFAIPGVVLAFGDRLKAGDEQVVIISKEKRDVAKVYGGRWQCSVDIIGLSQDDDQQERLVDYAISIFWAEWQDKLVNEGINVFDFSLSGEAEDLELEISEEYYYTGGISFTAEVNWELAVPLISEIRRIGINYGSESFKDTINYSSEVGYDKNYDDRMKNVDLNVGLQITPIIDPQVFRPAMPFKIQTRKYD
jgi:hypothetical protein